MEQPGVAREPMRYRIEHRHPDQAPLVVAFAIVDQDTETDVERIPLSGSFPEG